LTAPDANVAKWIVDLKRRVGNDKVTRVAQGDGQ